MQHWTQIPRLIIFSLFCPSAGLLISCLWFADGVLMAKENPSAPEEWTFRSTGWLWRGKFSDVKQNHLQKDQMTFFTWKILLWKLKLWHFKEQCCGNFRCTFVSNPKSDKAQMNGICVHFLIFSLKKWPILWNLLNSEPIFLFHYFCSSFWNSVRLEQNSHLCYRANLDFAGGKNQICSLTLLHSLQTISHYFVMLWIYFWLFTQLLKSVSVARNYNPPPKSSCFSYIFYVNPG